MVVSKRIRVDESFIDAMGRIGRPIAEKLKKQHNLNTLELDYPTLSAIIAGKLNKQKSFNFQIHKLPKNRGKLILL